MPNMELDNINVWVQKKFSEDAVSAWEILGEMIEIFNEAKHSHEELNNQLLLFSNAYNKCPPAPEINILGHD